MTTLGDITRSREALGRQALVVFEDRPATGVARLLRPGFRHCFCLLHHPCGWLVCDPLKGGLTLDAIADYAAADLARHYGGRGATVLLGSPGGQSPCRTLRPLTCVEVVKRAVGLNAFAIWTPWQLFQHLRADGREGKTFRLVAPAAGLTGFVDRNISAFKEFK